MSDDQTPDDDLDLDDPTEGGPDEGPGPEVTDGPSDADEAASDDDIEADDIDADDTDDDVAAADDVASDEDVAGDDDDPAPSGARRARPQTEGRSNIFRRLYYGETDFDFVGPAKRWFAISGAIIVIGLVGLVARGGLNLGLEFTGGSQFVIPASGVTVAEAEEAVGSLGISESKIQEVGDTLRIQVPVGEGSDEERRLRNDEAVVTLAQLSGVPEAEVIVSDVGASWGQEISEKALRALVFFLIAIVIYITVRFEFRMAMATLGALLHDIFVVVGVYAVLQLPVTPATVVAILTILGFSIYDGIVVFDRVDENTRLVATGARMTYSDMVNRSLNEVLMRSLNTQITALLPILSVLIVGSLALGQTTLQEFGLALFIGQMSGAYSSIFIASPLLAILKEREPRYRALRERVEARAAAGRGTAPASVTAARGQSSAVPAEASATKRSTPTRRTAPATPAVRTHPPRPRKQGKRR